MKRGAIAGGVLLFLIAAAGCSRCNKNAPAGSDAAAAIGDGGPSDGKAAAAVNIIDAASLPDTVVIVIEAGTGTKAECSACALPGGTPNAPSPFPGLPHQCEDLQKTLGTVYFSHVGETTVISSSKTKARASCTRKDDHTLFCDWVGLDGKPSVKKSIVSFGPKKPPSGAYDKSHRFTCKAH